MSRPVSLVPVKADAAHELSALCRSIYAQHYEYLWTEGGSDWYQKHVYAPELLSAELRDPTLRYCFIEVADRRAGFLRLAPTQDLPGEPGGMEVSRLYIDQAFCGQGVGHEVMRRVRELARALGRHYLWLHVMDSTEGAIRFYRASGFEIVGETMLPYPLLKTGLRRMLKMKAML